MSTLEHDVERIVREVFARLSGRIEQSSPAPIAAAANELVVTAQVVTVLEIGERLDGISRVVVRSSAVVTPAVRDLLKERNISLSKGTIPRSEDRSSAQVVMGVAGTTYNPAAIGLALSREGVSVEHLANTGLIGLVDELTDAVVKGGHLGVLWTTESAAALCLANRQPGTRAILGTNKPGVAKAIATVGANLLVLDPSGRGYFDLLECLKEFSRSGVRDILPTYRERFAAKESTGGDCGCHNHHHDKPEGKCKCGSAK